MAVADRSELVRGVGVTALAVAAARAIETARPHPTISDPYAEYFVHAARPRHQLPTTLAQLSRLPDAGRAWAIASEYVGVRTRFFDDFLVGAAVSGVRQVVILAAGFDVRPYRLEWPAAHTTYELDEPALLSFKDSVLAERAAHPSTDRRVVPVDLRDNWYAALIASGFDAGIPTAWLAEGLLPYLPREAERELLHTIDILSAPHSCLAAEQLARAEPDGTATPPTLGAALELDVDVPALIHHDDRPDTADALGALEWRVTVHSAGFVAGSYGRAVDRTCEVRRLITAERG